MKGLKYQIKSIRRDKMCILTFLLPVIVGIAINLLSGMSFRSIGETSFGVLENEISTDTVKWLQANGTVTQYETLKELHEAVNNPSTQMIGVLENNNMIQTLLSGDELEVNKIIADTLPQVYEGREEQLSVVRTIDPGISDGEGLNALLVAITLVTAMFMGCTFNAMNIISEKEEGIEFINQVLPMTTQSYVIQKMILGFIGGTISTIVTAFICVRIELTQIFPFLLIILLSAYISSLMGLFIGHFSNGLMVGIVYIKIVMILFIAPPIFCYLTVSDNSIIFKLSYLVPSSATFYGVMDLLNGQFENIWHMLVVLIAHVILWSCIYKLIQKRWKI